MLHVLAILLDLIRHLDARKSSPNGQYLELPRRRILCYLACICAYVGNAAHIVDDIGYVVATGSGGGVVPSTITVHGI
jgi:hypothetical protein